MPPDSPGVDHRSRSRDAGDSGEDDPAAPSRPGNSEMAPRARTPKPVTCLCRATLGSKGCSDLSSTFSAAVPGLAKCRKVTKANKPLTIPKTQLARSIHTHVFVDSPASSCRHVKRTLPMAMAADMQIMAAVHRHIALASSASARIMAARNLAGVRLTANTNIASREPNPMTHPRVVINAAMTSGSRNDAGTRTRPSVSARLNESLREKRRPREGRSITRLSGKLGGSRVAGF